MKLSENKIAFFDFCETIIQFQTADRFVDFCIENLNIQNNFVNFILFIVKTSKIDRIINKIFPDYYVKKRILLLYLRGVSFTKLNELAKKYYFDQLKPAFIPVIIQEIIQRRNDGFLIYIISGGYDIYIKYFVEEFCLDGILSTKLSFNNKGYCTGFLKGTDCIGKNKVKMLKLKFISKNTVAYSDSISDIPLLTWAECGVVVSRNTSQPWVKYTNFEEIIWV